MVIFQVFFPHVQVTRRCYQVCAVLSVIFPQTRTACKGSVGLRGWRTPYPRVSSLVVTISACLSCSDDEDVAPLSAKFADIYPLSNYDDTEVVASMNGIHSELNGGGENMALKDEVRTPLLHSDKRWHQVVIWCLVCFSSSTLKSINYEVCF